MRLFFDCTNVSGKRNLTVEKSSAAELCLSMIKRPRTQALEAIQCPARSFVGEDEVNVNMNIDLD